jgi:hypothetical protein
MTKLLALALLFSFTGAAQQYTKNGELMLPKDYRQWVYLASGLGMSYSNAPIADPNFENVFVNPAAYKAFMRTGTWPDKTMLMLEVRVSGTHPSNKDGRFQAGIFGYEVHVKDASRGGWQFYPIRKDAQVSGKPFPKSATCFACHEKNGATDTTFVQFYPTLIDTAKKMGTYKEVADVQ